MVSLMRSAFGMCESYLERAVRVFPQSSKYSKKSHSMCEVNELVRGLLWIRPQVGPARSETGLVEVQIHPAQEDCLTTKVVHPCGSVAGL